MQTFRQPVATPLQDFSLFDLGLLVLLPALLNQLNQLLLRHSHEARDVLADRKKLAQFRFLIEIVLPCFLQGAQLRERAVELDR